MSIAYNYKRMREIRKTLGVWGTIRHLIQSWLGITRQKDEIETLRYFFLKYHKLTDISETDDCELRLLQKCDTLLLGIVDKLFRKHGLVYWCDYGTLLGATRHKGFIPWDDDTDLAMPRSHLNKAVDILKDELAAMGISFEYYNGERLNRICVHFKHEQTGTWIDVFPIDEVVTECNYEMAKNVISPIIKKYSRYYYVNQKHKTEKELWSKKEKTVFNILEKGENVYYFHGGEFPLPTVNLFKKDWVFPIKRMKFGDVELNVPSNVDAYLKELYGNDYMDFPRTGVEHHGAGRVPLKKWYLQSGVNMEVVYSHLQECYDNIKNDECESNS